MDKIFRNECNKFFCHVCEANFLSNNEFFFNKKNENQIYSFTSALDAGKIISFFLPHFDNFRNNSLIAFKTPAF